MQVLLNGLIMGSAYALMGIGFTLLYSTVRYFDLAYGVVALLGAYVTYSLVEGAQLPFAMAMLLGALLATGLGVANYLGLFRVMVKRKSSPLVILVASFGLLTIYQNVIPLIWGNTTKALSLSDRILPAYEMAGLFITPTQLTIVVVAVLAMILLERFLQKTSFGMAIRAIGDNQDLTTVLGLKTERLIVMVYALATFLSAMAATLIALEIGIRPNHGVFLIIKAFIPAIIGGLGSLRGALIAGLLLGVVENLGIYTLGGQWQDTVAFVLLALFLLFRPQGMFAKQQLVNLS